MHRTGKIAGMDMCVGHSNTTKNMPGNGTMFAVQLEVETCSLMLLICMYNCNNTSITATDSSSVYMSLKSQDIWINFIFSIKFSWESFLINPANVRSWLWLFIESNMLSPFNIQFVCYLTFSWLKPK